VSKKLVLQILVFCVNLVFVIRLFYLQVLASYLKDDSTRNILQRRLSNPARGVIYDRNGQVLATNKPVFYLALTAKDLVIEDTARFCYFFKIEPDHLRTVLEEAWKGIQRYQPYIFSRNLSAEDLARIQVHLVDFPGVSIQESFIREYPHKSLAAALGYVKEVDREFLEKDTSKYYQATDLIGKSGIEASYEKYLRGQRGIRYVMVNVKGIEKGSYENGAYDTLQKVGDDLVATVDLELQQFVEKLMKGKKGAVVAIDPSNGEILSILSMPNYDPNHLTGQGKEVSKNYIALQNNSDNPLFNRALAARYPPGSTFKILQALIGLQTNALHAHSTKFPCVMTLVKCHGHYSPLNLHESIVHSCNPFYYQAFRRTLTNLMEKREIPLKEAMDIWKEHVATFRLGVKTQVDLPYESQGLIPGSEYYDKRFKGKEWRFGNVQSISIGQGEIGVIPLQMANLTAIIANRGYFYTPHIIKSVGATGKPLPEYMVKNYTSVEPAHFETVINAMRDVVTVGTGRGAYLNGIEVCGKTGTAQNPHGNDHSIFMAFAPKNNPQIALAVYIENAGFGGTWAAPMAGLIIEKWINKEIHPDRLGLVDYISNAKFSN